ncbi:MAG: bifunctional oligoribonuclease/PAP phosphatase NrnA [Anaerolineae bacterium]|nr:bifunctional oligoribonuclease/PAP phosphatase NrnA [Anaerolineae bacterium]
MTMTTSWTEAARLIHDAQRVVIVTHQAPDGDAIGSSLGLLYTLRQLGKTVDAAVDGGVPPYLRYLAGADDIAPSLDEGAWDVCISTDSSDEARTGDCGAYARAHSRAVINLDHHITNTGFGDVHLVVPTAVSAAEIAFDWLTNTFGATLSREAAQALLTGMVTDTLGFRTSSVTPRTLEIAQHLMRAGADLTEITARTLDNRSLDTLTLWREALAGFRLEDGVIWAQLPFEAFERNGVAPTTEFGLSEFLIQIDKAMVSVTFKQESDGDIKLSMRAKLGFDVGTVALALGGGGHKQAAGATLRDTTLDAAVAQVIPLLKEAVTRGAQVIR